MPDLHFQNQTIRIMRKGALTNLDVSMRFPTMWYVRPAMAQTSLCIRSFASRLKIL